AGEVGKELAEHQRHHDKTADRHSKAERTLSIVEAVLLAVVAVIAAWSGYAAAKWGTESSLLLANASSTRTKANRTDLQALQIRTLDAVEFNAAFGAYLAHDGRGLRLARRRLRPGYRVAFDAWLATKPLTNPNAPRGPAYMPQYVIPQDALARALSGQADRFFTQGREAGATSDKYVRITVFLATVLFLVGISGHFPHRGGRLVLVGIGGAVLVFSVIQLLSLPGPPS
ncbi:MAG: hypothetical protein ACXVFN_14280, partial [Solirubrobacteraceae bacterium]